MVRNSGLMPLPFKESLHGFVTAFVRVPRDDVARLIDESCTIAGLYKDSVLASDIGESTGWFIVFDLWFSGEDYEYPDHETE